MTVPRLSILVSTIDEGVCAVEELLLPPCEEWQYVVSWQQSLGFAPSLTAQQAVETLRRRDDVVFHFATDVGLSANRNHCLELWDTELALIADDDMRYTEAQLLALIRAFDERPAATVLCGQVLTTAGAGLKSYPSEEFSYRDRPKGYSPASVEIALRKHDALPWFDVRFGLGAPFLCAGEEEVFVHECFLRGLSVEYVPMALGVTTAERTTHLRPELAQRMRYTKGAVLRYIYGPWGGLARLVKSAFVPLRRASLTAMYDYLRGYLYL